MRSATEHPATIPVMNATEATCFRLYVELGNGRSIPKLHKRAEALDLGVSLRQLLRWSHRYAWAKQAERTTQVIAQKTEAVLLEDSITHNRRVVASLREFQERFIERLAIDPTDPNLTEAEASRAIDPDFRDFCESIKLERLILSDPTARREDVRESRLVVQLGESELLYAARAIAAKRYGLPTDAAIAAIRERAEREIIEHSEIS
jgi:hypothetical protein